MVPYLVGIVFVNNTIYFMIELAQTLVGADFWAFNLGMGLKIVVVWR